jgi:O-antigen/teichoic acid export membrane protein
VDTLRLPRDERSVGSAKGTARGTFGAKLAGRFGWGLADQAMSSLSNAMMSFYVARELGAVKYGAFSIAYVTYSFALNVSRGLATEPLIVRYSNSKLQEWRLAVSRSTGTAIVAGIVMGCLSIVAGILLHGTVGLGFIALGLVLPGLMLQDSWRYAFFALGRGAQSFLNDLVWTVAMLTAVVVLHLRHADSAFWFLLVWGMAATFAACLGPLQSRVIPNPVGAREWFIQHRDLGLRFMAENAANSGSVQLRAYCIGGIAGLATVGYVQAASLLMGPFFVIYMGISIVTVPEAARILQNSPRHLRRYCMLVGGGLAGGCALWGIALLVTIPRGLGSLLLGHALWPHTYGLIIPYTIAIMGSCLTDGAQSGLHALGAARRSMRSMLLASALYLGLGIAGAHFDGALGTVCGAAVAVWIGTVVWWKQLHTALRETVHETAAAHSVQPARTSPVPLVVQPGSSEA